MSLKATIASVTGDRVTVAFEDGQTLDLPASAFEGAPAAGLDVGAVFAVSGAEDAGRQALARDLLNSLLSA